MYRAAIITKRDQIGIIVEREGDVSLSISTGARSSARLAQPVRGFGVVLAVARLRGWHVGYVGQVSGEIISGETDRRKLKSSISANE
jgi:hypothetical protein